MGAVDKNDQIACLNKTRCHYRRPCRLFMKFLVWAAYNAYIIMDSYRPHSHAGHNFCTFHMFEDELCCSSSATTTQQSTAVKPGPSSSTSFLCRRGTTPPRTFPGCHWQQPLCGLLCQVQQVRKETPGHRIWKHAPQAEEDHVLVFHMPQVPLPPCRQHMLE